MGLWNVPVPSLWSVPPYHRVSGVFRLFFGLHNQVLAPTCSDRCTFSPLSNQLDSLQMDFSPGVETSKAQWEEPGGSCAQAYHRKGFKYFCMCVSRLQKFQANLFNSESRNQFHATTACRGSFYSVLVEFQHQLKTLEVQEQADGDSNLEAEDTEWEHEETSSRSSSC